MPYTVKKVEDGYKVCKTEEPQKCFSNKGLSKEKAEKQKIAIGMSGGLKPLTARVGGKVLLKKKIVDDYFPSPSSYSTYVEPFVGGGSIYFYKNKDGHKEVINDIDPDIMTIFNGFKKYPANKIAQDVNGNYTENDFNQILESDPKGEYNKFLRTFLLYRLSYFGRGLSFGKSRINSKFTGYQTRLEGVDIYNTDYKDIIKKYNKPNTFFYLDPPARESSGNYRFSSIDIPDLVKTLKTIKGKFLLSIADIDVDIDEFKKYNVVKVPTKYVGTKTRGGQTQKVKEYLIMNYKPRLEGKGKGKYTIEIPPYEEGEFPVVGEIVDYDYPRPVFKLGIKAPEFEAKKDKEENKFIKLQNLLNSFHAGDIDEYKKNITSVLTDFTEEELDDLFRDDIAVVRPAYWKTWKEYLRRDLPAGAPAPRMQDINWEEWKARQPRDPRQGRGVSSSKSSTVAPLPPKHIELHNAIIKYIKNPQGPFKIWLNRHKLILVGPLITEISPDDYLFINDFVINNLGDIDNKIMDAYNRIINPKLEGYKIIGGGTHRENILKRYKLKDNGHSLEELSKVSAVPLNTLQEVYNRGIGAYKTNPQSVRLKGSYVKNVNAPLNKKLSKEQWAMARVYSFLDGNAKHDNDLRGGLKITKDSVTIPKKEFIREHKKLVSFFEEQAKDQGEELKKVTGGMCGGCDGACGGAISSFQKKLSDIGLKPKQYLKQAKTMAEKTGYDPSKVMFCNTGKNKLMYESPDGLVHFGNPDYPDYIIYSWLEHKGEVEKGTADKRRELYRARATNIKGNWKKNKYSANNLAINILW